MKKIKLVICGIVSAFVIGIICNPLEVKAYTNYCQYSGCRNETVDSKTDYCIKHKCAVGVCNYSRMSSNGIEYCTGHYHSEESKRTCGSRQCIAKKTTGSKYCAAHTCRKGRLGCYNQVSGANEKCDSCKKKEKEKEKEKNKSVTYTSPKKTTTTKKKRRMPDCDDYDSYEDFMDDWDGCMPDGSDAEDYWENW